MAVDSYSLGLLFLASACGGSTLDPVQNSSGGSGGTGGTGSGATSGSGGTSGGAGSGGGACTTPNPAGCKQTGCAAGLVCNAQTAACKPSSCNCDTSSGLWGCTADCQGGSCTPDPSGSTHFVRIGFADGQVKIPELCVSYQNDSENYIFETQGLLAQNGETAAGLNGLKRLTAYLPLKQAPLAFGIASSVGGCASVSYIAEPPNIDTLGLPPTHFTLLSAP